MSILDIALKDIRLLLKDKKALLLIVVMPIILITILSSALKGSFSSSGSFGKINVAIVKEYDKEQEINAFKAAMKDNIITKSMDANELTEMLNQVKEFDSEELFFEKFLEGEEIKNMINYGILERNEAMSKLDNGEVSAIVILPEGIIYDMYMNVSNMFANKAQIQMVKDTKNVYKPMICENIIAGFCEQLSAKLSLSSVLKKNGVKLNEISNILEQFNSNNQESVLKEAKVIYENAGGKKSIDSFSYYAAAMSAMFILFIAANGSEWLKREKDDKTLLRLKSADVPKSKILFGKFFAIFALCIFQFVLLYLFSYLVLGVAWGSLSGTVVNVLVSSFSVSSLGVLLAVIVYRTDKEMISNLFGGVIIQLMAFLGGSYIPIDTLPGIIKTLGKLTINGNMLNVSLNNMQGLPLENVYDRLIINITTGILVFVLAVFLYFKEDRYGCNINVKA